MFIYGKYGYGKTVLLMEKAIQQAKNDAKMKVIFITIAYHIGSNKTIHTRLLKAELGKHGIMHKTCRSRNDLYSTMDKFAAHHIFIDELYLDFQDERTYR